MDCSIPFLTTWNRLALLYAISIVVCVTTFFVMHTFSYLALGHALFHALVIPTILLWLADTLLYGQQKMAFWVTCGAILHPGYFVDPAMPFPLCGMSGAFLIFLILAINTFHFRWAELPRHVVEAALLYAPEMGLLTGQYDRLIDEIGYNKWYAKYRTVWLLAIGASLGALMTVSPFFLLLALMLFSIYAYVSSSYESMAKKIITISIPLILIVALARLASSKMCIPQFSGIFDFLLVMPFQLMFPSFALLRGLPEGVLYKKFFLAITFILEALFCVGTIGTIWLFVTKNSVVRHVLSLVPLIIAYSIAVVCEGNKDLFWMLYPVISVIGALFWVSLIRPCALDIDI